MKKLLIILAFITQILGAQYPCATFDGINNYISIQNDTSLSFGNGTTDEPFFISADIYMDDASDFRYVAKTFSTFEYILFFNSSDRLAALLYDNGSTTVYIGQLSDASYTSLQGQWINVVMTYDGSSTAGGIDLYIDGVQIASSPISSGSYTAMSNQNVQFSIGADRNILADGRISNVRVCSGNATAGDISTFQNPLQKTGKEVAWWPLTEGYSDVIHNVIDRTKLGFSTDDVSGVLWDNIQSNFDYNTNYGYTRFVVSDDTTIVPYLSNETRYVRNINTLAINGQSNALGRAELDSLSNADSVKYWKKFSQIYICDTVNEEWELVDAGINNYYDAFGITDGYGPELSIGYNWEQNYSSDLYLFKFGERDTPLDTSSTGNDWYPTSQELFTESINNFRECLSFLPDYGVNPFLKSYVWIQGEADALNNGRANHYSSNINYYFDSLASNFNTAFNKTISRISDSPVYTYGTTVRNAQTTYASLDAAAELIDTDTISRKVDNVHYNHIGQISLGNLIYNDVVNNTSFSLLKLFDANYEVYDYPETRIVTSNQLILINSNGQSLIFNK